MCKARFVVLSALGVRSLLTVELMCKYLNKDTCHKLTIFSNFSSIRYLACWPTLEFVHMLHLA